MSNALKFSFEWVEPADARGEELRATWASLLIQVGDQKITSNVDEKSQSYRESIILPLYPLAEWIACNWWALLGETYNSKRTPTSGYRSRHSFVSSSEGFAMPELSLQPEGDQVHVVWTARENPWAQVKFINEGKADLPKNELESALRGFVEAIVQRLEVREVKDTLLQEEWLALHSLDVEETKFCSAVGQLGRDPFNVSSVEAAALVEAAGAWDDESLHEMLSVIDPYHLKDTFANIRSFQRQLEEQTNRFSKICAFREQRVGSIVWTRRDPWQIGYHCAKQFREWLGAPEQLVSTNKYDKLLGINVQASRWGSRVAAALRGVDCLLVHDEGRFAFGVAEISQTPHHRFVRYRAVFEMLATGPHSPLAIVSEAHSARQKANRAFAAEFLAPAAALRAYFSTQDATEETIHLVAQKLGVSEKLITHQLVNHRIISESSNSLNPFRSPTESFGVRLKFNT